MEPIENIIIDLEDWQNTALREGFESAKIFAFPFLGDYHLVDLETGLKIIPYFKKIDKNYNEIYLSDDTLKVFREKGFELFTRCGSLINNESLES